MLLLQEIEFGRIQFLGQTAGFCSTWNIEIRDKTMGIKMFKYPTSMTTKLPFCLLKSLKVPKVFRLRIT